MLLFLHAIAMESSILLPGLPNHIAILCLLKVPRIYHTCLSFVCTSWRKAVRRPEFYQERRRLGLCDPWLVVVSSEIMSAPALLYSAYDLTTKQLLFKVKFPPSLPASASPPALPEADGDHQYAEDVSATGCMSNIPDHFRVVAIDERFAVLGFTHHSRLSHSSCTLTIYNTVTDKSHLAAPRAIRREMFACGVIGGRLYVTGGMNEKGEMDRSAEAYDFETKEWRGVARLPEGVVRVQADVVFQGKLYLQCWEAGVDSFVFWVYDPGLDEWKKDKRLAIQRQPTSGGGQQLIATDKFLYLIGAQNDLCRFEAKSGRWEAVGRAQQRRPVRASPTRGAAGGFWSSKTHPEAATLFLGCVNSNSSQRAFGYGDDIFLLQDAYNRVLTARALPGDSFTRCHRLFASSPSWYLAGAVVQA